jgi:hypothetical protein
MSRRGVTKEMRTCVPPPTRGQALEQLRRAPDTKGICRECGCTENNACIGQGILGDETCGWANQDQTLCTNPDCLEKAKARARK